jgi:hypothetical protein
MINALYNHLIDYDANQKNSGISTVITGNNIDRKMISEFIDLMRNFKNPC